MTDLHYMGTSRPRVVVALVAALALAATVAQGANAATNRPSWVPSSAQGVLDESFSGNSLDSGVWATCYPWASPTVGCTNAANAEQEWYLPQQARVSSGALHLVAERASTTGLDATGSPLVYPYRSGIVTTAHHVELTYGYVQIRARIPKGQAMWPALWLLPADYSWPPEIDLMEAVGQQPTTVAHTLHALNGSQAQGFTTGPDFSAGWHTFGVAWTPGRLTWYVDDVPRFTVQAGVPSGPMYLLANLAVGGSGGGAITSATPTSASFDVDWVRVWH